MNEQTQRDDESLAWALSQFLIRQCAHTVEVFFRHGFGERYFEFLTFYGVFRTTGLAVVLTLIFAAPSAQSTPEGKSFFGVWVVYVWMAALHQAASRRARRKGRLVHSRFPGYSARIWRILPLPASFCRLFLEPVLGAAFGWFVLLPINPVVGAWTMFASLCMYVVGLHDASRFRRVELDSLDSRMEAEGLSSILADAGARAGASHEVTYGPPGARAPNGSCPSVEDAMERLNPELQRLIQPRSHEEARRRRP